MEKNALFNFKERLASLLMLILIAISCSEESNLNPQISNMVASDEIARLASSITFAGEPVEGRTSGSGKVMTKKLKSLKTFSDEAKQPVFYAINYEEGGFVIISADNRALPVLAYSDAGTFPTDENDYPSGLVDWMSYTKNYIGGIRRKNKAQSESEEQLWNTCEVSRSVQPSNNLVYPDDDCGTGGGSGGGLGGGCQDTYETVGPLIQTTWDQGCGYNNFMPGCNDPGYCNKAPTGCVATAMSQVMKYHKFPTNYNWSIMPNSVWSSSNSGSSEISRLMKDIGSKVSMEYACDGSSADTKSKVATAFLSGFGYSSAVYIDYSWGFVYDMVKSEFRNKRPVIFRGGENVGWWIFNIYGNGHAWVGDGYSSAYYCNIGVSTLYFHMNWGWGGSFNGYYAFDNFNPDGDNFNYKSGVVININP